MRADRAEHRRGEGVPPGTRGSRPALGGRPYHYPAGPWPPGEAGHVSTSGKPQRPARLGLGAGRSRAVAFLPLRASFPAPGHPTSSQHSPKDPTRLPSPTSAPSPCSTQELTQVSFPDLLNQSVHRVRTPLKIPRRPGVHSLLTDCPPQAGTRAAGSVVVPGGPETSARSRRRARA